MTIGATLGDADHQRIRQNLSQLLELMLTTPSAAGAERELAERIRGWGRSACPGITWEVDPLAEGRANLLAYTSWRKPLGFYAHLDTSLSGDPELDVGLTGNELRPGAPLVGAQVSGLGLAVSKGPGACALAALAALSASAETSAEMPPVAVLLSAGGTHRAPTELIPRQVRAGLDEGLGYGVEAALRRGFLPRAVVNVKGGADGVLYEEPGCLLLRITLKCRMVAVPARGDFGGAAVQAAVAVRAIERWRQSYLRDCVEGRQTAPDLGVGAIESGLPYKPDILPGLAVVYVYIVLMPEVDASDVVERLVSAVEQALSAEGYGQTTSVEAESYGHQPGAATDARQPIVIAAQEAWDSHFGPGSHVVTGYTGSTDGIIFRRNGIPTVRLGPTARQSSQDATVEEIPISTLEDFAVLYLGLMQRAGSF